MNGGMDSRRFGCRGGFTLIEIMVALVIMGIALTAIYSTFLSQQKSYLTQNAVAQMQQAVRGGMVYIESDLRNAAGIPSKFACNIPSSLFGGSPPATLVSGLGLVDGGLSGSDNIYVISYLAGSTTLQKSPGKSVTVSSELDVTDVTEWNIGDFGIIYNENNCDLFFVTNVQTSPTMLQHNPAGSIFGNNNLTTNYATGANIARISYSGYYIDSGTNPAHPALMHSYVDNTGTQRNDIVAEDIEDMQLLLGVYDNVTNVFKGEYDGVYFETNQAELRNVRHVRIQLVGRTSIADSAWNEGPYLNPTNPRYNRTGGIVGYDHRRRRPLEAIIYLRNAGL